MHFLLFCVRRSSSLIRVCLTQSICCVRANVTRCFFPLFSAFEQKRTSFSSPRVPKSTYPLTRFYRFPSISIEHSFFLRKLPFHRKYRIPLCDSLAQLASSQFVHDSILILLLFLSEKVYKYTFFIREKRKVFYIFSRKIQSTTNQPSSQAPNAGEQMKIRK